MSSICRTFKDSNDKLDILREILIIFSINYKKFEGFASVFFCSCNFTSLDFFISNRFIKKAVAQTSSVKKVFLEISQNSKETTLQAAPATLLKKRLWHRCFPVNIAKYLRTPFFTEHLWWLLLL